MGRDSSARPDRTSFVGRERELAALRELLAEGTPLVTITGPSGMGKTRLAQRLAAELAGVFVGIESCRTEADLRSALAEGLGVSGESVTDELEARGPLLLVLDNVDPASRPISAALEQWLDRCPDLCLLVTSLIPLGIRGEVRFELGPLEPADAVALYLDRAREAWADRVFTAPERDALADLVIGLDRLPLAIELAAARVRVLPPKQLLERLGQRLDLLRSADTGHHGSLARALSLSWNLLTEGEQRVLARASTFVGGFTLEAAEEILDGAAMVDHLDGLRAKALVQHDGARFSLYESVRAFAAVRLREMGGEAEVERRHAAFFAGEGEVHARLAEGPGALEALRWLAAERENLFAAHRRSFATAPELSARAGLAIAALFTRGGLVSHEREILDATVQAARRTDDAALVAQALYERGRLFKRQGDTAGARQDLDEGIALARAQDQLHSEGYLLTASAALRVPGAAPEARAEIARALAIAAELRDTYLEGQALLVLGALEESMGALELSAQRMEEALALFRSGGRLRYCAIALLNLGSIRSHRGRFSAGRQALEEACSIFAALENLTSLAYATTNLGSLALAMGQLDEAERHLLDLLAIERRLGNRLLYAVATGNLGMVALERGELREGERRLAEAVASLRELGAQRHRATLLPFHAAALAMLGGVDEARVELAEARAVLAADPASLQMLALLESIVDLAEARRSGTDVEEFEARAHERLEQATSRTVEELFVARRLLEKALAQSAPVVRAAAQVTEETLVIGRDTAFFALGGGERVDLRRRTAIRRILRGLAENRLIAPGVGLSSDELAAIGWPGEKILPTAAATRVWSAIRILRSLGLAQVLLRHADGYLLDPALAIVRDAEA